MFTKMLPGNSVRITTLSTESLYVNVMSIEFLATKSLFFKRLAGEFNGKCISGNERIGAVSYKCKLGRRVLEMKRKNQCVDVYDNYGSALRGAPIRDFNGSALIEFGNTLYP